MVLGFRVWGFRGFRGFRGLGFGGLEAYGVWSLGLRDWEFRSLGDLYLLVARSKHPNSKRFPVY